ncbi:hypothetical protein T4C_8132 [Trichinella pseudospiralis]|uniref:Uncharacterized protein n=1 Tax=Trichinella pseudospiralis TaxID=6337 RepID=A0A0V1KA98_TRIPS|nr:hypothetical protein T4C_8132 [Trichinella pseudospiralis]
MLKLEQQHHIGYLIFDKISPSLNVKRNNRKQLVRNCTFLPYYSLSLKSKNLLFTSQQFCSEKRKYSVTFYSHLSFCSETLVSVKPARDG